MRAKLLTAKDLAVIEGLLTERTIKEAAKAAKVSPESIYRSLKRPEFIQELRTRRCAVLEHAVQHSSEKVASSIQVLESLMHDDSIASASRIMAAKTIIETAIKGAEVQDFQQRLEGLERMLEQLSGDEKSSTAKESRA